MFTKGYSISNAAYISEGKLSKGSISIKDGFISSLDKPQKRDYKLEQSLVTPAFINTYDSLIDSYYPKVGYGKYKKWQEWYTDFKNSEVYREKSKLDKKTIYLLGAYRNFLSGVLTVLDYQASAMGQGIIDADLNGEMPIRVLNNHVSNMSAQEADNLCVVNISEKCALCDKKCSDFFAEPGSLNDSSMLIHGVFLSDNDIENISKAKASLLWSPCSDNFMFDRVGDVEKWLDGGVNISLASASAVSGSGTFLDEIRFAKNCYKKMYGKELHEKILYNMITGNAAKCLKISTLGMIKENATADLLILKDTGNPYKAVSNLVLSDIEAIIQNGRFVYANEKYSEMVYESSEKVYSFNVLGEKRYCSYDIKGLLEKIRNILGYIKELPFLPID